MGTFRPQASSLSMERATPRGPHSEALDIVLAWLVWLPESCDVAVAARAEIARIDKSRESSATLEVLRSLFVDLAHSGPLQ